MREYLYVLKHNDALVTSIVPVGDGAAVAVKQKEVTLYCSMMT
jgi:predicted O-methyltransferase YrrM